jgi:hypothetical protein
LGKCNHLVIILDRAVRTLSTRLPAPLHLLRNSCIDGYSTARLTELATEFPPHNPPLLPRLPHRQVHIPPWSNATTDSASLTASLLVYLFGLLFIKNYVLVFIVTIVLLAVDFYYLKNIAGRRLVGLRWWNEVNMQSGDSHWVFESADPDTRQINATDRRFFWLALYSQPVSWVALGVVAIFRFEFIWLSLVGMFLLLLPCYEHSC